MKIIYSIWQGSLYKGTLNATSMKDVIATVKELNEGNTSVKFEHMVNNISQVA
jgi:hypothetical protein